MEDIKSTVDIIEKIVDNVTPHNIAETPKVRNISITDFEKFSGFVFSELFDFAKNKVFRLAINT